MSAPTARERVDSPSLGTVRSLLQRNLLDRAVSAAETRWPGSGAVVSLAHDWVVLSPADRRNRLAAIGPEDLSRFRAVAELQPDLARVLDDLEERGVIPPAMAITMAADAPVRAPTPPTREEVIATALIDLAEQGAADVVAEASERVNPAVTEAVTPRRFHQQMTPLPQVSRPALDLGLPSMDDFLATEAERREELDEQSEQTLERIRARLDRPTESLDRGARTLQETSPVVPASDAAGIDGADVTTTMETESPAAESVRRLVARLRDERVVELDAWEAAPSESELSAAGGELGLGLTRLEPVAGQARWFYGGLRRQGRAALPYAGAFPTAVSQANIVLIDGRLYPKTIERLRAGYCDIPGTSATVAVHPDCRIIVAGSRQKSSNGPLR